VKTISRILIGATMLVLAVLGYVFGLEGAVNLLAFCQLSMAAILIVLVFVIGGIMEEIGCTGNVLSKADRSLSTARIGFGVFQLGAVFVAVFYGGWFVAITSAWVFVLQEFVCYGSDFIEKAKKTSCTK